MDNKISFEKLLELLSEMFAKTPDSYTPADIDVDYVEKLLNSYDSNPEDWGKYALTEPNKNYTRNFVEDFSGKANFLILVWNPERSSLIHDHANAHCVMKVLKGSLVETMYNWPDHKDSPLVVKKKTNIKQDQVAYISDTIGIHKISNPSSSEIAVSLHIYTPPWAAQYGCLIFDEKTGKETKVDVNFYSKNGEKLHCVSTNA